MQRSGSVPCFDLIAPAMEIVRSFVKGNNPAHMPPRTLAPILAKTDAIASILLVLPPNSMARAGTIPRLLWGWTCAAGWGRVGPRSYPHVMGHYCTSQALKQERSQAMIVDVHAHYHPRPYNQALERAGV